MKKLIPVALLILVAAVFVTYESSRATSRRSASDVAFSRGAQLPASAAPSLSTAPVAVIPESGLDAHATSDAHAVEAPKAAAPEGPTPERIAAENELLASYGTQGTTPERLGELGWYPALSWTVEVWTYRMQDGDRGMWDEKPTPWRFKVEGLEVLGGRNVWALSAEPADLTGLPYNPGGTIYVAADDHAIVALRDRVQEQGEIRERFIVFDDVETSAISTLLPVELPPAGIEGRARDAKTGALPPNPLRPEPKFEAPTTSGRVVDVEFESDGSRVRQRWDAAQPYWPLYSRTPSRISVLRK